MPRSSSRLFWIGSAGGLLLAVIVIGLVAPFFRPPCAYTVVSGSMANRLCGPHSFTDCHECGFSYRCGHVDGRELKNTFCPNCGSTASDRDRVIQRSGDTLMVEDLKEVFQRWQTVLLRSPTAQDRRFVKRLVGLPGERIGIRNGDLYINGAIPMRSLDQFRATAVLVHDDRYRPQATEKPDRWLPERAEHRWTFDGRVTKRSSHSARETHGIHEPSSEQLLQFDHRLDWLSYRHRDCSPAAGQDQPRSAITDYLPYNQGLSLRQHLVADVMLGCHVTLDGGGLFVIRIATSGTSCAVIWDVGQSCLTITPTVRGEVSTKLDPRTKHQVGSNYYEVAVFDQRVVVGINKTMILVERLPPNPVNRSSSPPLAVLAHDLSVQLRGLRVFRDIYYLDPNGANQPWNLPTALGPDEYFVLGDNPAVSIDSRHWRRIQPLSRNFILGNVFMPNRESGNSEQ